MENLGHDPWAKDGRIQNAETSPRKPSSPPSGSTRWFFTAQPHLADDRRALSVMIYRNTKEFGADPDIEIQMISDGCARVNKGRMAMADVPSAWMSLDKSRDNRVAAGRNDPGVSPFILPSP